LEIEVFTCSDPFSCNVEIIENTVFKISKDAYGKTYIERAPSNSKNAVKIEIIREATDSLSDSEYREEFIINSITEKLVQNDTTFFHPVIYGQIGNFRNQNSHYVDEKAVIRIRTTKKGTEVEITVNPEIQLFIEQHKLLIKK
jgi:hypothetical protein